ncbi:MAG: cell division protein WhiA [Clostridia bacterium]|nr:cell division protein WhiA [Clostridia bacterium]
MSKSCCRLAELAALLRLGAPRENQGQGGRILLVTENAAVARKAYLLLKEVFNLRAKIDSCHQRRLKRSVIYRLEIDSRGAGVSELAPERIVKQCCRQAYLRGAFLASGSVSDPKVTHHLEFNAMKRRDAAFLVRLLRGFNLEPKINRRRQGYAVYLKDSEQIIRCLGIMGAHAAVLEYESVLVYKEVRANVNRLVNCETANLNKTVNTGLRQTAKIRYLQERIGLEHLPASLREVAELRLAHPEASLRELGEMLEPRLGKSGINHRLRRLETLADKLAERQKEAGT